MINADYWHFYCFNKHLSINNLYFKMSFQSAGSLVFPPTQSSSRLTSRSSPQGTSCSTSVRRAGSCWAPTPESARVDTGQDLLLSVVSSILSFDCTYLGTKIVYFRIQYFIFECFFLNSLLCNQNQTVLLSTEVKWNVCLESENNGMNENGKTTNKWIVSI